MDFGDFHLKAIVSDFKIAKKYLMGLFINNYSKGKEQQLFHVPPRRVSGTIT